MSTCTVNGREHVLEPGETLERLLERIGLQGRFALVERNGEPVPRDVYPEVEVEAGDELLVARPVAGG